MAKSKIPDSLYVVSKPEVEDPYILDANGKWVKDPNPEITNFGFLHANDGNLKKQKTQNSWAYIGTLIDCGDKWKLDTRRWVYEYDENGKHKRNPNGTVVCTLVQSIEDIDPQYAPRVWDNVPLTNFKIVDTVNRYRGNKLFKVLDPRGVVFEVTVKSLFALIQESTIVNGVIQDKCVWKTSKDLVLAKNL